MNFDQFDKGAVIAVGLIVGSALVTMVLCGKFDRPWRAVKGWLWYALRPDDVKLGGKKYPLDNGQVKVDGLSIPLHLAKAWAKKRPLEDFLPWQSEVACVARMGGEMMSTRTELPDDHYRFTEMQWNGLRARVTGGRPTFEIPDAQVAPPGVMYVNGSWWALGQYADGSLMAENKGDRESAFKKIERVYNHPVAMRLWAVHHPSASNGSTGEATLGTMPVVDDILARQMGVGIDWAAEQARLSNARVVAMRGSQPVITAVQGPHTPLQACAEWNRRYSIGTRVAVNTMNYAVRGDGATLTPAYVLTESGVPMVYVTEPANVLVGCPIPLRDLIPLENIEMEMRRLATPADLQVSVGMVGESRERLRRVGVGRTQEEADMAMLGRFLVDGSVVVSSGTPSLLSERMAAQAREDSRIFSTMDAAGNPRTPEQVMAGWNATHRDGDSVSWTGLAIDHVGTQSGRAYLADGVAYIIAYDGLTDHIVPIASVTNSVLRDPAYAETTRVATQEELCMYWNRNHAVGSEVTFATVFRGNSVLTDGSIASSARVIDGQACVRVQLVGTTEEQSIPLTAIQEPALNAGAMATQARPYVGRIEIEGHSDRYTDSVTEWAWRYVADGREVMTGVISRQSAPTQNDAEKIALKMLADGGYLMYEEPQVDHPLNAAVDVDDTRLRQEFFESIEEEDPSVVG